MIQLKKKALKAKNRHEFLSELMKWYSFYIRKYPIVKKWTKSDVYNYYYQVKKGIKGANYETNDPTILA